MFDSQQNCYVWWSCVYFFFRKHNYVLIYSSTRFLQVRSTLHVEGSQENDKKLALSFNLTFRNIDRVISLNKSKFGDYIDLIYRIRPEKTDTLDTSMYASNVELHLYIDIVRVGWERNLAKRKTIYTFQLLSFHLYVATLKQHLCVEYIYSTSWYYIPELLCPISISFISTLVKSHWIRLIT